MDLENNPELKEERTAPATTAPGDLPTAQESVQQRLRELLGFARTSDGRISIAMPRDTALPQLLEDLNTVATGLGLTPVMLQGDIPNFLALQARPGVAATPGERYDIDLEAAPRSRSFAEQKKLIEMAGGSPTPLTAIALAGMAVKIASLGKENLFANRHVRGAASGLAVWSMNGSICVEHADNGADPSITMAG